MLFCFFFFFNDTATTEIYTLSLHDALPICFTEGGASGFRGHRGSLLFVEGAELGDDGGRRAVPGEIAVPTGSAAAEDLSDRSEEHTSELQSRLHLVCRLLLEKKKKTTTTTH